MEEPLPSREGINPQLIQVAVRVNLPTGREPAPNIAGDKALATNTSCRKITSLV
jgi:hypothetical protein